jgi:hypothetical protein
MRKTSSTLLGAETLRSSVDSAATLPVRLQWPLDSSMMVGLVQPQSHSVSLIVCSFQPELRMASYGLRCDACSWQSRRPISFETASIHYSNDPGVCIRTRPWPTSTGGSWSRPLMSSILGSSIVCGVGAKSVRQLSSVLTDWSPSCFGESLAQVFTRAVVCRERIAATRKLLAAIRPRGAVAAATCPALPSTSRTVARRGNDLRRSRASRAATARCALRR